MGAESWRCPGSTVFVYCSCAVAVLFLSSYMMSDIVLEEMRSGFYFRAICGSAHALIWLNPVGLNIVCLVFFLYGTFAVVSFRVTAFPGVTQGIAICSFMLLLITCKPFTHLTLYTLGSCPSASLYPLLYNRYIFAFKVAGFDPMVADDSAAIVFGTCLVASRGAHTSRSGQRRVPGGKAFVGRKGRSAAGPWYGG